MKLTMRSEHGCVRPPTVQDDTLATPRGSMAVRWSSIIVGPIRADTGDFIGTGPQSHTAPSPAGRHCPPQSPSAKPRDPLLRRRPLRCQRWHCVRVRGRWDHAAMVREPNGESDGETRNTPKRSTGPAPRPCGFASHCLLNQNERYLGGAGRLSVIEEAVAFVRRQGAGVVQMPCPEQCVWGGVGKG